MKKYIYFSALCLFFNFGCNLFEKSENKDEGQQLVSTLDQDDSFFDQVGQYDEYFFNLEKKLEITYNASALQVTSGSPNIINQQISFNTIPEYLLYITPDQGQYSDSLYNTELLQFENYEETSVITSDIRNKIVKPHSGIESIDSIVWSGEKYEFHTRDLDKDDLDDNTNISENEDIDFYSEMVDGDAIAYLDIQGSNFLIWTDDQIIGNKEVRIIDSIANSLVFIDLEELDTTIEMVQAISVDSGEDKFFEHMSVFKFDQSIHVDSILYQLIGGDDLNDVLYDQSGDTIKSFLPNQAYFLSDGTEFTPIQTVVYMDTVFKSFIDYASFDTLVTNDIIDTYNSSENVYSVVKTISESITETSTDYFIYRQGVSSEGYPSILELIYPSYFNYYGGIYEPPFGTDPEYYDDNGWSMSTSNRDSVFFYLPFRSGEIVEREWSVVFDDPENGNGAQYNIYSKNMVELTSLEVLQFPIEGAVVEFNISEDSLNYIFNDVFKVTKTTEMAMYGTGVTYFEEQIYWLVKNLGIVKQQLWYHWGDGSIYPPVLGTEWTMSSYSESDVNSSASGLVFTSLDEFAQAVGFEKYKFKRSAGLKKLEPVN